MTLTRCRALAEHCVFSAAAWIREAFNRDEVGVHRTRGGALPTSELVANQRTARERKHRAATKGTPRARFAGANLARVVRYNVDWAPRPWWLAVETHFARPLATVTSLRPSDVFGDGTRGYAIGGRLLDRRAA